MATRLAVLGFFRFRQTLQEDHHAFPGAPSIPLWTQRRCGVRPPTNSPGECTSSGFCCWKGCVFPSLSQKQRVAGVGPRWILEVSTERRAPGLGGCENGLLLWSACSLVCSVKLVHVCGSTRSCVTRTWGWQRLTLDISMNWFKTSHASGDRSSPSMSFYAVCWGTLVNGNKTQRTLMGQSCSRHVGTSKQFTRNWWRPTVPIRCGGLGNRRQVERRGLRHLQGVGICASSGRAFIHQGWRVVLAWERRWSMLATTCAVSFAASLVSPSEQCETWCHTGGEAPTLIGLFDHDPR